MAAPKRWRAKREEFLTKEEEFLTKEDIFRRNAFIIIDKMLELNNPPSGPGTLLVDEILHSIFFLGKIHIPPFSPKRIVSDDDEDDNMLEGLWNCFRRPFELYSSQLPKRSPISCMLDMIVHLIGQKNENQIIERLGQVMSELKRDKKVKPLISTTICVSHNTSTDILNSDRYYGVSMSTSGGVPGRIMIAASCLGSWDSYVAGAVMTYYPYDEEKSYFNGTIKLPKHVRCQAFNIKHGTEMNPCRSCGNLFGLETNETIEWPYGNCAEAESVSNLLKNVGEVREQARPLSVKCTNENRKRAEENVLSKLQALLREVRFTWVNQEFYTPQRVRS